MDNRLSLLITLVLSCALGTSCSGPPTTLEAILAAGELRVATLNSGTTYFKGPDGYRGFEHDLVQAFGSHLGVTVRFEVVNTHQELAKIVRQKKVHLAAALLPIHGDNDQSFGFGPSYSTMSQTVIYRRGKRRPKDIDDLRNKTIAAPTGRGARDILERELPFSKNFYWSLRQDLSSEDLLDLVDRGEVDFVVIPSEEFEAARLYYPETRQAFVLGPPQAVGWLYQRDPENSLWAIQLQFLNKLRENGELKVLRDRYFGHTKVFDYVEARAFLRHYNGRLPKYREAFIRNAADHDVDWMLLAAMSYQESHWLQNAKSPTGVRGLMMLTKQTATDLKVDRLDPEQSIQGGTQYLAQLKIRLPERITDPDKTWFALAAYNVGLGHLEDARVLADKAGLNPDRWTEVRQFLPKLANKVWASKTKHGYARGYQAVHFVENIRRYYDVLRWLESDSTENPKTAAPPPNLFAPVLPQGT